MGAHLGAPHAAGRVRAHPGYKLAMSEHDPIWRSWRGIPK
jgi:hypothetical protein